MQETNHQQNSERLSATNCSCCGGQRGFTLIELIVAMGIFTVVVFGVTSALLSVVSASQRGRSTQRAINNLNIAVDDIVRNMTTGFYYDCGDDDPTARGGGSDVNCPPSGDGEDAVSFINQERKQITYDLQGGQIIKETTDGFNGSNPRTLQITSPDITINSLRFYVSGAEDDDNEQSTVLITVAGTAGTGDSKESFNIQTSVTKRLLNP